MSYKTIINVVGVVVVVMLATVGVFAQSTGTFKDSRDGKTYKTVKVGDKTWMAENLNFAAKGSACYENKDANCTKYGRLYDWETANKVCPAGFHLPSDDEWTALVNYAGGEENAGKKLKSKAGWNNNGNGTDDYGWSALPGGFVYSDGNFYNAGDNGGGGWWSAEDDAFYAPHWRMFYDNEGVYRYSIDDTDEMYLYSVRCVHNQMKYYVNCRAGPCRALPVCGFDFNILTALKGWVGHAPQGRGALLIIIFFII
jgi:uncharacterized protein (TIGR02145 family)